MEQIDRSDLISQISEIHKWELENLPTYGTLAGYELFIRLAGVSHGKYKSLKEMYLSMSCTESTTRLLFRNLEVDGWIHLPRSESDKRFKEFHLTDKFYKCLDCWLALHVEKLAIENS